ncbi:unnamed protein product [Oppiella nova]|uniref:RNA helicase n=1 Tax=Oppiella nova TaxID=334625 RepID=A0A7R9QIH1_9ACAR|nr:unnamed protein product [Oppiella nova]CAG2166638.1 unnamed protein product [Oppiella nova]
MSVCLTKSLIKSWLSITSANKLSIRSTNVCLNTHRFVSLRPNSESTAEDQIIDVQKYREEHGIQCFGDSIPDPIHSFDCYKWPQMLDKRIQSLDLRTPTPIQSQSLPIIFSGRDLVAIANSGSGKTLCFVLPALMRTLSAGLDHWPKCLVLTPTRELTHQVERVVKQFRFVRSVCLYGGVSYEVQEMLLKRANPHIVIATPARMHSILEKGIAKLEFIDFIAVDEADLMLQMGMGSHFNDIMTALPQKRQTLMLSATWPPEVQHLADRFLKNYIHVSVSKTRSLESLTLNKNIQQLVKVCKESEKDEKLMEYMNEFIPTISGFLKTIIFVRHKRTADRLVRVLKRDSFPARALHSDKEQNERDFVIREFRKGSIPILVATEVASRGLDFKDVRLVLNYDFPSKMEDYIHRIGRTGRHKDKGTALTLFTAKNICHKESLIQLLTESGQQIDQNLRDLSEESDPPEATPSSTEDSGYESSGEYDSDSDNESKDWASDKSDDEKSKNKS